MHRWRPLVVAISPVAPAVVLLWLPRLVATFGGLPGADGLGHTALSIPALMAGGLAPLWVAVGWAKLRGRTVAGMAQLLRDHGWLGERLVRFLVLAPTVTAFFGAFALWKSSIPRFHPGFVWDAPLERAELWLHRGYPDRILAPLFGSPSAIFLLDRVYHTWFYFLFAVVIWQAWGRDHRKLRQFWTSFALLWVVLGIIAATLFASAGPIYARLDRGSASYDGLITRLVAAEALGPLYVHLSAWSLWNAARQGGVSLGDGISAFPSLHVGFVTLAALAAWSSHRLLGMAMWGYVLLILIGSIVLGWHYALDGEAAVLATIALWIAVGRWSARKGASLAAEP
jgi:PAP2 superfamily